MFIDDKEFLTVRDMAERLEKNPSAVKTLLFRYKQEPISKDALYPIEAYEIIKKALDKGRPTKYIKLFMGNPTTEKVKLFFNSAKKVLKEYIRSNGKSNIVFSLSSSIKSPVKPKRPEIKEYNEISSLVWELFEKQNRKDILPINEILPYLKKAANIGIGGKKDEELLDLIDKIENPNESADKAATPAKKSKK